MHVCPRCGQTYSDEEPRWDCACGPARPAAGAPAALAVAASDDPMTWYDHYSCYPADAATVTTLQLRRPLVRPTEGRAR